MRLALVLIVGLAVLLMGVATTTAFARTCPCTIFSDSDGPAGLGFNDGQPLELGVKFRSAQAGTISGVRFFKSAYDSGDHSVHLWAADGTSLASAPSTGESPSGWQTVTFVEPVEISADTTYVASYHSSSGWYTFAHRFFAQGIENPPLRALADGEDGPNGVYAYGSSTFPVSSYQASGYWVDVVFEALPEPTPAPMLVELSPDPDEAAFDGVTVRVAFDLPVDAATINSETFQVQPGGGDSLPAEVSYDEENRSATWRPLRPLEPSTRYVATVRGGAAGVRDSAGTPLTEDVTWRFTTAGANTPSPDVPDPAPEQAGPSGDSPSPEVSDPAPEPAGPSGDSPSPDVADPASEPARSCASRRRFQIRLAVPAGARARDAVVWLNGKRLTVTRGARWTAAVDLRGLPKGNYRVHVRVRLADGRRLRQTRTYSTCSWQ